MWEERAAGLLAQATNLESLTAEIWGSDEAEQVLEGVSGLAGLTELILMEAVWTGDFPLQNPLPSPWLPPLAAFHTDFNVTIPFLQQLLASVGSSLQDLRVYTIDSTEPCQISCRRPDLPLLASLQIEVAEDGPSTSLQLFDKAPLVEVRFHDYACGSASSAGLTSFVEQHRSTLETLRVQNLRGPLGRPMPDDEVRS